jgi:MFS family permease
MRFRALRHGNFALFLGGQVFALVGYWVQQVAISWLVYRLTGSALLLGVLSFAANLPVLLLAPFAGLWSDRFNRHRMMIATQVAEMLQAVALTALAFGGVIATWHIVALTAFLGICVAVELPVRHAYLLELVGDKQDLPNAVATTSLVANCGRLIGPVAAGVLIGWLDEASCFLVNALTYIAVLASFAFIHVQPQQRAGAHPPALHGLREGIVYAWQSVPIRLLLTSLAVVALTAAPYGTLMPAIVHEMFDGTADTLGFLIGAAGFGALCGTLVLAMRSGVHGLLTMIVAGVLGGGTALVLFSWSRVLALSLVLMVVVGFCILVISVATNMILQAIVEDDKRGRVMSLYTAAFLGVVPFGGLIGGTLADHIGAARTVTIGGTLCIAGGLYLLRRLALLRSHVDPVYAQLAEKPG